MLIIANRVDVFNYYKQQYENETNEELIVYYDRLLKLLRCAKDICLQMILPDELNRVVYTLNDMIISEKDFYIISTIFQQ